MDQNFTLVREHYQAAISDLPTLLGQVASEVVVENPALAGM